MKLTLISFQRSIRHSGMVFWAEAVELIEDWANGLELDYEDIDDSVRLLGQMRRALGEEES